MKLDNCGCCQPASGLTPLEINNRPGLSAIAYRIGTYSSFRRAMLHAIAGTPELAALRTRLSDDYAITLFELWATIGDVLTFYQERIANEGFLRTARLRDSILRIARLIDYQLAPGTVATTLLAFTLEKDARVEIPVGLRVQSVPGQDEKPQKFETLEAITADSRFNSLRIVPAPVGVNPLGKTSTAAFLAPDADALAGAGELRPGDQLVLCKSGASLPVDVLELKAVRVEHDRVKLSWSVPIQSELFDGDCVGFKLKRKLRIFGHNAPASVMTPIADNQVAGGIQWTLRKTDYEYSEFYLLLDGLYDDIAAGASILFSHDGVTGNLLTVSAVESISASLVAKDDPSMALEPLSATVTGLTVWASTTPVVNLQFVGDRRQMLVYELEGRPIRFWSYEYPETMKSGSVFVPGQKIDDQTIEVSRAIANNAYLPGVVIGLKDIEVGRRVLLQDSEGHNIAAAITAASLYGSEFLRIDLDSNVESIDGGSAVLLGNVARAGHGETVKEEVLGDGDATARFQQFSLKKKPLTYLASADDGGLKSSLRVLVNRVLWKEAPTLYGQSPGAQVHVTRIADDGGVTVQFGDNRTGAAPMTGRANVMAIYRHGVGLAGRVRAGALTTLLDRPVGLRSAINLMAAEGGANPETLGEARENAPSTVRAFGRAVSLRDFEDLALESGEVAKARATWVWDGEARAVHLTVAGQEAAIFSPDALGRLHASLTARRDPNHALLLGNFTRVPIMVAATLHVSQSHIAEDVEAAARASLVGELSFESLKLGQPIHLSDLYKILQEISGVTWVKIDLLQFKDQSPAYLASRGADEQPVQEHLRIYCARITKGVPDFVTPAEQAWIEVPTQDLTLMTSGGLPL